MRKIKTPLAEILRAGQWRSAAFMHYMDNDELNKDSFCFQGTHVDVLYIASSAQDIAFEAAIQEDDDQQMNCEWID